MIILYERLDNDMKNILEKVFIVEGIIFALVGILFLFNPISSFIITVNVSSILLICAGIFSVIRSFGRDDVLWGIINGAITIIFGIVLLIYPIDTAGTLIMFYGIWALVRGIYLLIISFKRGDFGTNYTTTYNVLLILLGLLILFLPIDIVSYTSYIIGIYLLVTGISEIYLGFKIE